MGPSAARVILAAALALPPSTWDILEDARSPATLADCPGAVLAISYSSSPILWQRFCYFGAGRDRRRSHG